MSSDLSQALKDQISRGEDLATAALKQVFGLTLDPTNPTPAPTLESESNPPSNPQQSEEPSSSTPSKPTVFRASDYANDKKRHLLLSCTGSVATIKLPNILHALSRHASTLSIRVILTTSAAKFLAGQSEEQPTVDSLRCVPGVDGIYDDADEWEPAWTRGAPILHIELRRWADALVVAPLGANSLAKVVGGLCDGLLTSVVRAWDTEGTVGFEGMGVREGEVGAGGREGELRGRKMILVAPAMNTAMWKHPLTGKQVKVLEEWEWVRVLTPTEKSLACGDVGTGAMKEWSEIVKDIEELLQLTAPKSST